MLVSFRVECRLSCRRKNFFLHGAERESLAEREPDLSPDGKGNRLAFRGKVIDFREEDVVAETVSREGVDGACPVERDAVLFLREETLALRLQGRETDLHQKIVVVRMTENGKCFRGESRHPASPDQRHRRDVEFFCGFPAAYRGAVPGDDCEQSVSAGERQFPEKGKRLSAGVNVKMIRDGLQQRIEPYIAGVFQAQYGISLLPEREQIIPAESIGIEIRCEVPHENRIIGEENRREKRGKCVDVPSPAVGRKDAGEEPSAFFQFRYLVPGNRNQFFRVIQRGECGQDRQPDKGEYARGGSGQ